MTQSVKNKSSIFFSSFLSLSIRTKQTSSSFDGCPGKKQGISSCPLLTVFSLYPKKPKNNFIRQPNDLNYIFQWDEWWGVSVVSFLFIYFLFLFISIQGRGRMIGGNKMKKGTTSFGLESIDYKCRERTPKQQEADVHFSVEFQIKWKWFFNTINDDLFGRLDGNQLVLDFTTINVSTYKNVVIREMEKKFIDPWELLTDCLESLKTHREAMAVADKQIQKWPLVFVFRRPL